VILAALVALGAGAYYFYERPKTTDVAFLNLPVGGRTKGGAPMAPEAFPECTIDMLEPNVEDTERHVDVTFRVRPDVQCAIPEVLESWWIDAEGTRYDPPPGGQETADNVLLMGKAGLDDSGGIDSGCDMQTPVTYTIDLAGKPFEVGAVEKVPCSGDRTRLFAPFGSYRTGGLETPAAWLDARVETPRIEGSRASFVFELTNDTPEDIVIGRCPFIDVEFLPVDSSSSRAPGYRTWLNCPAAPDMVEPGDLIRFQIRADIDPVDEPGRLEVEMHDEERLLQIVESEEISAQ
jgi:hypothetical protein